MMPFKVKYRTVGNPAFIQAVKKLNDYDGYPNFKAAYNVARIAAKLDQELKTFDGLRIKLVKKHAEVDEEGNPVKEENGNYRIKDSEAFTSDLNDLLDLDVTIERHMIKASDLENARLTPAELLVLEGVLDVD